MKATMLLLAAAAAWAAAAEAAPARRAPDPAFAPVTDDPALPRVLLIGDSISVGYTLPTRERLRGKANVHRIPENGGPTSRGVQQLEKWLGEGKWDVVQMNFGLHDLRSMPDGKPQVTLEEYERNLRTMVARLKRTGARLIWASTTPVPEGNMSPPRKNADVIAYNAVAKKVMDEHGVAINDLYAFAMPRLAELQRPVNVHFSPQGSEKLADKVVESILAALKPGT